MKEDDDYGLIDYLRDIIGRGAIAGTAGAPIDIAETARSIAQPESMQTLRGTVPLPPMQPGMEGENAIGGSEWLGQKMQDYGAVSDERHPVSEFLASIAADPGLLASKLGIMGAGVIKGPGGQWLKNSVEEALRPLTRNRGVSRDETETFEGMAPRAIEEARRSFAADDWIDNALTRYIKNEMATPNDPVRLHADAHPAKKAERLAEMQKRLDKVNADRQAYIERQRARGLNVEEAHLIKSREDQLALEKQRDLIEGERGLHVDPEQLNILEQFVDKPLESTKAFRRSGGFPEMGMGVEPTARRWEAMSDNVIGSNSAEELMRFLDDGEFNENPWLTKVPPDTRVHSVPSDDFIYNHLGLDHLLDEIRNSINPESGLPPELQLKYQDLPKKRVVDTVEHVDKINAWRAAQKAEADLARANNRATHLVKEYPESGHRWVELKKGENEGNPWESVDNDDYARRLSADDEQYNALRDALKYEGDTMQHCVGGYCEDVANGQTRIFSLRDAKGQPGVTIETQPYFNDDGTVKSNSINQIKGRGNQRPDAKYDKMTQDFVRTMGPWSEVRDLENTGLIRQSDINESPEFLTKIREHFGDEEFLDILEIDRLRKGYAEGGQVQDDPFLPDFIEDPQFQADMRHNTAEMGDHVLDAVEWLRSKLRGDDDAEIQRLIEEIE